MTDKNELRASNNTTNTKNSFFPGNSTKERFQYSENEKSLNTTLNITLTNKKEISLNKNSLFFEGKQTQPKDLGSEKYKLKANPEEVKHRRYRKNKGEDIDPEKTVSNSSISALNTKVNYAIYNNQIEELYSSMLKNNINPDAKQINKLINELEKNGVSGTETTKKLIKYKDCSNSTDIIEQKIVVSPLNQVETSYENYEKKQKEQKAKNLYNLISIKEEVENKNRVNEKEKDNQQNQTKKLAKSNSCFDVIKNVEDNLGSNGMKKKRYENTSEIQKHHNASEKVIYHPSSHAQVIESLNEIKQETLKKNKAMNDSNYHRNKKIGFMMNSQAFIKDKKPLDYDNLVIKKSSSIMQNYSSQETFSFFNVKKQEEKEKIEILTQNENKARPAFYKNVVSDENFIATGNKEYERKYKHGKIPISACNSTKNAENSTINKFKNSIKPYDQTKSNYQDLFSWKVKKVVHDPIQFSDHNPLSKTVNDKKTLNTNVEFKVRKNENTKQRIFGI